MLSIQPTHAYVAPAMAMHAQAVGVLTDNSDMPLNVRECFR